LRLVWGVEEKTWPKFELIWSNDLSPASYLVNLSPELIFVNVYPLRKNNKPRRGAQTSNRFEKSPWVHVWGVVGKTWPKHEVNPSTGLSPASIFVHRCPSIKITNEEVV
jgi:hypothetical protein